MKKINGLTHDEFRSQVEQEEVSDGLTVGELLGDWMSYDLWEEELSIKDTVDTLRDDCEEQLFYLKEFADDFIA